jgi:hypothetical protein
MKTKVLALILLMSAVPSCAPGDFGPGPGAPLDPVGSPGQDRPTGAIQITYTGRLERTEFDLSGFSAVEIRDFFECELRQGQAPRVVILAEPALKPYLDVAVRGNTLQVGLSAEHTYNLDKATQRVEVTLPALTGIHVRDFSTLDLAGFENQRALQIEVMDFSELRGSIDTAALQVTVSNHSSLSLDGIAAQVVGAVTSFSSADLVGLDAADVRIQVDASSSLK